MSWLINLATRPVLPCKNVVSQARFFRPAGRSANHFQYARDDTESDWCCGTERVWLARLYPLWAWIGRNKKRVCLYTVQLLFVCRWLLTGKFDSLKFWCFTNISLLHLLPLALGYWHCCLLTARAFMPASLIGDSLCSPTLRITVTEYADERIRAPNWTHAGTSSVQATHANMLASSPGHSQILPICRVGFAEWSLLFMQAKTNGNHSQCRRKY